MGYDERRVWAMQFDDHIQLIVCKALRVIRAAPDREDMRRNTDFQLIYAAAPAGRVAARVRRARYYNRHFHEITFRLALPSGADTEWQKMISGYGQPVAGAARGDHGHPWLAYELRKELYEQPALLFGSPEVHQ